MSIGGLFAAIVFALWRRSDDSGAITLHSARFDVVEYRAGHARYRYDR
jgi:hypothetical protein